jgi:AcrR family transcriptional regulator
MFSQVSGTPGRSAAWAPLVVAATGYDAAMARPLIPVDAIYTRALELLDAEGIDALQARKLAADLKISTRTLYQQVGNREQLIRALVARHFSQLRLDFREHATFDSTALHWCLALHDTLRAHPYLTELMAVDDRKAIEDYVNDLVKAALREGFPRKIAIECCRTLVNVTINHTIVEVRALREPEHSPGAATEVKKIEKNFPTTIRWILMGVRADLKADTSAVRRVRRA